jgi:type III restriction enzyme
MQLKNYQSQALEILQHFCKEYSRSGLISQSYSATKNLFEQSNPTYLDYEGLNVPNVCLRIPTGGGKTLLAVHSLPIITFDLLNNESSLVFWLAPSDQIVEQTINALKNPRHPYRKYLDGVFAGRTVNVLSIEEAYSKAFDISCELPIIIATIQTFSTESEEGRRFYRENGVYQEFFENSNETPSLYNAIKKCNPIVIMDEAHNAKTDLRVSSLVKLEPSFILELTATPRKEHRPAEGKYASNVIYSVSASQLKAEDMIKLPIRLETVNQWQSAIRDAIEKRNELEELCKLEQIERDEYIRPLILFRAESNRGSNPVTHETILETLLNDYGIDRSEIAVHTSGHTELKNVDLMQKDCPIRYVITVEALKEGWDAPFAYILASVGDINSPTAVEQILGRILRLPYAKRKHYEDLEKAYAYVASTKTTEVIKNLRDSLVNNGFEELEANLNISFSHNSNQASDVVLGGLFEERETKLESFDIEAIPEKFKSYINVNHKEKMFSIIKLIPPKEEEEFKKAISKAVNNEEDRKKILSILEKPPILLNFNKPFSLSRLLIKIESELFEFDKSILLEEIEWTEK